MIPVIINQLGRLLFFSYVQDPRLAQSLVKKHGESVADKSFVICSGLDMVNVNLCNVIAKDKETAEVA